MENMMFMIQEQIRQQSEFNQREIEFSNWSMKQHQQHLYGACAAGAAGAESYPDNWKETQAWINTIATEIKQHKDSAAMHQEHEARVAKMRRSYEEEVAEMHQEHEARVAAMQREHEARVAAMQREHEARVAAMQCEHEARVAAMFSGDISAILKLF